MSGWTLRRRTPAPIRDLCDETSKPTGSTFYDDLNRELQDPAVAADFAANAERIQAIDAGHRAEAGRWQPRYDDDPPFIPMPDLTEAEVAALRARFDEAANGGRPLPTRIVGARATADLHAIDDRRTLEDRYLAVCQQLREVTADRDRLDEANGRLLAERQVDRERIRGLELTVAAQAGHRTEVGR